jgi:hypothetical protein
MLAYILFVSVCYGDKGCSVSMQEFGSEKACFLAKKEIDDWYGLRAQKLEAVVRCFARD